MTPSPQVLKALQSLRWPKPPRLITSLWFRLSQSARAEHLGGLDEVHEAKVLLNCLNPLTIVTPLAKRSHSFRRDKHGKDNGAVCGRTHREDGTSPVLS